MMKVFLSALVLIASIFPCFAEQTPPQPATIRVTGEATITVVPDTAEIDIGVLTQAETAKLAAARNAEKLDRIVKTLRPMLNASDEIKTINYSLNPIYTYPREGGQGKVTGYEASNTIEVRTGDLDRVGKIVDASTQAGANKVEALRFSVRDEAKARIQALALAAAQAKRKAEALAEALGVKIARIYSVEEGGPTIIPVMERRMAATPEASEAQTVIEPGTLEVQATVTLTAEITE